MMQTPQTDPQIQQDVLAELAWEPSAGTASIGVEVKDGVVTLTGHVASFNEKWEAEHAVQRVSGVKTLAVDHAWITLTGQVDWSFQKEGAQSSVRLLEGVTGVSDRIVLKAQVATSTVKADIEEAFQRRARADAGVISVAIDGAEATLAGAVHSWSERLLARRTAWATPGVHRVIDHMTVAD